MKRIDSFGSTVDNKFTDGDPLGGIPATIVAAIWLNAVQEEITRVIEAAGIVLDTAEDPDLSVNNQLLEALQSHAATLDFYIDSGAVNAYDLTPANAYIADVDNEVAFVEDYPDGMRVRFFPTNASTGAATAKIGDGVAKNIKTGAGAGSDPASGALPLNVMVELCFDAVNDVWKIIYPAAAPSTPVFESKLLHVQDQKASGTNGPNPAVGANIRHLNTVLTNEISGASLASNKITLPAGTYYIEASAVFQLDDTGTSEQHQAYLYNQTDGALVLKGTSEFLNMQAGVGASNSSRVSGRFTIAGAKDFELRHYCDTAYAGTLGLFGRATGSGNGEVYADVKIWKLS